MSILGRIEDCMALVLFHSRLIRAFARLEREEPVSLSLVHRLRAWRHGMTSDSYATYRLCEGFPQEYVSDYEQLKTQGMLEFYGALLRNKVVFELAMRHYLRVPRNLAFVMRGRLFSLQEAVQLDSTESLLELARRDAVVLKPACGAQGTGVIVLRNTGTSILANDRERTVDDIQALISGLDNYVITEFVKQGVYAAGLYPRATNTIRLLTMVDPDTQEPFIPIATQRIGTAASAPVDNWHAGGIAAPIDLETGVLGAAAVHAEGIQRTWQAKHPETGSQIEGVEVPYWEAIKDTILRTVRLMPYLKHVGWDIALADDGPWVIEANGLPGLMQEFGPYLRHPRMRRFYQYHRIVNR